MVTTLSTQELDAVIARLSKAQRKGLIRAGDGGLACSYLLQVSIRTCEALHRKGLVGRTAKVGAFVSPRTAIEWPLTEAGAQVRARLMEEQSDG